MLYILNFNKMNMGIAPSTKYYLYDTNNFSVSMRDGLSLIKMHLSGTVIQNLVYGDDYSYAVYYNPFNMLRNTINNFVYVTGGNYVYIYNRYLQGYYKLFFDGSGYMRDVNGTFFVDLSSGGVVPSRNGIGQVRFGKLHEIDLGNLVLVPCNFDSFRKQIAYGGI